MIADFEKYYEQLITGTADLNYPPRPLHQFFLYLIQQKNLLLHGSLVKDLPELHPATAKCFSKQFGNRRGVYASSNCFVPIMFAIASGSIKMNYDLFSCGEEFSKEVYWFDREVFKDEYFTLTEGMVYVVDRSSFEQGLDDQGKKINEWISVVPVKPVARFVINPDDFPGQ